MTTKVSGHKLTRAEQETQTEAERLNAQIEQALAVVAVRSSTDIEDLELCADRLERAARDLSVSLRELAHERRHAAKEATGRLVAEQNHHKADQFFNATQQERLSELMKLRQTGNLSTGEASELESLIEDELDGARQRTEALLDELKP